MARAGGAGEGDGHGDPVRDAMLAHPLAGKRSDHLHGTAGMHAAAILDALPTDAGTTHAQATALLLAVLATGGTTNHAAAMPTTVGRYHVRLGARSTLVTLLDAAAPGGRRTIATLQHHARAPGVVKGDEPREDPGAAARGIAALALALARNGYGGPPPTRDMMRRTTGSTGGLHLATDAPHGHGTMTVWFDPVGLGPEALDEAAARAAMTMSERRARRHEAAEAIGRARAAVEARIAGDDGMAIVRMGADYAGSDATPTATLRILGHDNRPTEATARIDTAEPMAAVDRLRRIHRGRSRRIDADGADLSVSPVLAAALRATQPRFAARLVEEIEAATTRTSVAPANPVMRGIGRIRLAEGRVDARVALSRGARWRNGRIAVDGASLPRTTLAAMPGSRVRDVVDHPFLEGLTVRSASSVRAGVFVRPDEERTPLAPVLEELRRRAAERDAGREERTAGRRGRT